MRTAFTVCFALVFTTGTSARPHASQDPLSPRAGVTVRIQEAAGVPRLEEPVTFAVPLSRNDRITDVNQLVVRDPTGAAIPFQARVTQRWHGNVRDASRNIRWILVDLQVDVPANATVAYSIHRRRPRRPDAPTPTRLDLTEDQQGVLVETGSARFRISSKTANFLDLLMTDTNGDGRIDKGEELIDRPSEAGFVLTDRFGARYSSSASPIALSIEEQGPLRSVVRVDGLHHPIPEGSGIARDFFQFRTRYTFFAGKAWVRVQHTLRNAYLDNPLGSIGFEGYALTTRLTDRDDGPFSIHYGLDNHIPHQVHGASRLYQDSDGGHKWNQAPGTSFRGFTVRDDQDVEVASGAQATGFMQVKDGAAGVTLFMRDWFENFPKGYAFDGDDGVRFDIFPEEFGRFHHLDDGQQKTTDFFVIAHGPKDPPVTDLVRKLASPLHPFADPEWTMQTRAWGDLGDLDPNVDQQAMVANDDGQLQTLYLRAFDRDSFAFGWSEFGEPTWAKNTHTTGSPRNRLSYFHRFAQSGSLGDFRMNELFALHSRDIRTYHIDGFVHEARPGAILWEGLPPWPRSEDMLGRDMLDPALDPHREGISGLGHGWNAFDFEHLVVDDLFEYYLLTGDLVTLDSLHEIGECIRSWPIFDETMAAGSTRGVGWGLRALVKIWQVTGDQRFLQAADRLAESAWRTYGKRVPSPITGERYSYITRYAPHPGHIADAEYDLPWQLAVVIHGLLLHSAETGHHHSEQLAIDIATYLVRFCWSGSTMHEAVAADDHSNVRTVSSNTGTNLWIPSALALTWRVSPKRTTLLDVAMTMYESLPSTLTDPNHSYGYGLQHWWLGYKNVVANR